MGENCNLMSSLVFVTLYSENPHFTLVKWLEMLARFNVPALCAYFFPKYFLSKCDTLVYYIVLIF